MLYAYTDLFIAMQTEEDAAGRDGRSGKRSKSLIFSHYFTYTFEIVMQL